MRKFRFRFEAVERVKRQAEESALRALAAAQRAFQASRERRAALLADLERSLERRELLGQSSTPIAEFLSENDFIVGSKARIVQADQAILRASRAVEKALRNYLAAKKETRKIETLREKEHALFKREAAKREQREADDLSIMRARLKGPLAAGGEGS